LADFDIAAGLQHVYCYGPSVETPDFADAEPRVDRKRWIRLVVNIDFNCQVRWRIFRKIELKLIADLCGRLNILDYSPPTKDLTEQGFRLIGGRLDYLDNRPVAALVYQRSQHVINLFVWPSNSPAFREPQQLARQRYNLIHWTRSGMTYWLISELDLTELNECARLLKE